MDFFLNIKVKKANDILIPAGSLKIIYS